MPGDVLTVRMWDDGEGRALFQTVTQDGTVVIDGGVFALRVTRSGVIRAPDCDEDQRTTSLYSRQVRFEGDPGGADEGAVGAERAGDDPGAAGEVEAAARVELALARRRRTARRSRARPSRSTTASGRSSRLATDATARPTSMPGALAHLERRLGRRARR